jgi:hypothetical protein
MGYQVYLVGKRYGGYGVPAICEYPDCNEEIDRGMSFACGGEPFSEIGCDRYFCSKHRKYTGFKCDGSDERCDHEDDCECTFVEVCERCAKGDQPFDYKPEHPTWVKHLLKDPSWKTWRKINPDKVADLKKQSAI